MTTRSVFVKGMFGLSEEGIGSVPATVAWESDPDAYGAFAHLSQDGVGVWWLSITDMENPHGAYESVPVTEADLRGLVARLRDLRLARPDGSVQEDPRTEEGPDAEDG